MPLTITPITTEQDQEICKIIKSVGEEFGAVGDGFGPSDEEVLAMSQYYHPKMKSVYLVAQWQGKIVGGCGLAPFNDSLETCELKKLFLLPDGRGLGIGKKLSQACLDFAVQQGYKQCYLDTLTSMTSAIRLYESLGFTHLKTPMAETLHNGCDVWMLKTL